MGDYDDKQDGDIAPAPDLSGWKDPRRDSPPPDFDDSAPVSSAPVSLGPLALLGFGPKRTDGPVPARGEPRNVLLTIASLVVIIAALKIASPVLIPLTVSAFLATLTAPLVLYLKRKRIPPAIGVPLAVIGTLAVLAGVTGLVVGSVNAFVRQLPAYEQKFDAIVDASSTQLASWGLPVTASSLSSLVQPEAAIRFVGNTISEVADMLSDTLLVLLMTVFVLFEAMVLPDKIRLALGDPKADLSRGIQVVGRIKAYVVVKTSTSLATGIVIGLALELLGVDFALLWGLIAFLFNFIPNIGSIIAAVPATLLALLQLGVGGAFATMVIFVIVNMTIGSFLEPRIMGKRMNLSPLVVFVSLLLWGWLWGPVGMLLSVPLTMVTRILLDGNEETRPFAILMAGAPDDAALSRRPNLPPPSGSELP
jgi:predicted PurR-regulated permease PerM